MNNGNNLMEARMNLKQALKLIVAAIVLSSVNVPAVAIADSHEGKYIVVLGAPGSGKTSNSKWMSEAFDIPWINLRDVLSAEVQKEAKKQSRGAAASTASHKRGANTQRRHQSTRRALEKLVAGELVSDDSLNAFVASQILSDSARNGFILDSYPVTPEQAGFLDSILEAGGIEGLTVIYLDVSDEVALARLKAEGKAKFKRSFAEERIAAFRSFMGPVTYYYGDAIHTIDANQDPSAVTAAIAAALKE
jgi:adenylate kinase family enzyme